MRSSRNTCINGPQGRDGQKLPIVFYAHGGLTSEQSGLLIADQQIKWWLENGAYPIHFVWETGLSETLAQMLNPNRQRAIDWLGRRWSVGKTSPRHWRCEDLGRNESQRRTRGGQRGRSTLRRRASSRNFVSARSLRIASSCTPSAIAPARFFTRTSFRRRSRKTLRIFARSTFRRRQSVSTPSNVSSSKGSGQEKASIVSVSLR